MAIMGADAAVLRLHPTEIPMVIAGAAVTASALMVSKLPVPSLAAIFVAQALIGQRQAAAPIKLAFPVLGKNSAQQR